MAFLINCLLILLLEVISTSSVPHVTNREIASLGMLCDKKIYSCAGDSPKNCKCDSECAVYSDCCFDSPHRGKMNWKRPIAQCIVRTYVINECPSSWDDGILKYYCESYVNITEPLSTFTVFSENSGISYRNYHCAICNGDANSLQLWPIQITCNSSEIKDIGLRDLQYNRRLFTWGVWYKNLRRQLHFASCNIKSVPKFQNDKMRICIPSIGKCASDWDDDLVKAKCKSYNGITYAGKPPLAYRNIHCALCNRVDLKSIECSLIGTRTSVAAANFVKIFQINIPESEDAECGKEYIYDPVQKKCQSLSCLPFQEVKDDRCVPKN